MSWGPAPADPGIPKEKSFIAFFITQGMSGIGEEEDRHTQKVA